MLETPRFAGAFFVDGLRITSWSTSWSGRPEPLAARDHGCACCCGFESTLGWIFAWSFALLCESLLFACPNKSNQNKRHPVLRRRFAPMPSHRGPQAGRPETRCAQTSGRPWSIDVAACGPRCSALRPRGPNTNKDRLANASPRSRSDLWSATPKASPTGTQPRDPTSTRQPFQRRPFGRRVCIQARCTATETRSGDGCPAHCAGAASMFERRQSDASLVN